MVLRRSNRAGLGSVVISVTRVIHLGHFLALPGLGVARAVVEAGLRGGARRVRGSCCRNGLRSTTSSAKGIGEGAGAHRGLRLAGEAAQGGRRHGPGGGSTRSSVTGSMRAYSELLDSVV
jgi:hypothetical protein